MKLITIGFGILIAGSSLFSAPIFSVQSGGITITGQNVAPAGTQGAPWTLNETMTSGGIVALTDTDGTPLANSISPFASGSWLVKSVLNNSGVTWTSFEIELQEILGTPSPDGDGLSFAQGQGLAFTSNLFSTVTRIDTTRDYLNFSGGSVLDGQTVTFAFAITDNSPQSPIFINQTPNKTDDAVPEPATFVLLGAGLLASSFVRRKL